jgi:predicted RNA methylase
METVIPKEPKEVKKGKNRNSLEKFYTKDEAVKLCIEEIKTHIKINPVDLIIEPSAGNGAFFSAICELTPSQNPIFLDIDPPVSSVGKIQKQDYLSFEVKIPHQNVPIHVIGNPPFGKQSKTANQFIKKSAEFANTISFILPKSFKKPSMQRIFPPYFHLVKQLDLPEKSFTIDEVEHNVPCIFQIWEKRTYSRPQVFILEPSGFLFVKKDDAPDISVRRVGVYAGKVDAETANKSVQSHYFISFLSKIEKDAKINQLKQVAFEHDNTVGPKSISKQEIIAKYNAILGV